MKIDKKLIKELVDYLNEFNIPRWCTCVMTTITQSETMATAQ